jgi:hypothetical protein
MRLCVKGLAECWFVLQVRFGVWSDLIRSMLGVCELIEAKIRGIWQR